MIWFMRRSLLHSYLGWVINLLVLWNTETILKRGFAGVLPVIGWVLAVLQASLAVQIVIYSLRVLEVLHWPAS